jgi:phosphoenolpyruvate carboxykinase (GTP)
VRVLKWIIKRVDGEADANEPSIATCRAQANELDELLKVDRPGWQHEIGEIGAYLDSYGARTPEPLKREQRRIADALNG